MRWQKKASIAINTWLDLVDRLRQRFVLRRAARRLEAGHERWSVEGRQRVIAFLGRCNGRGRLRPGIVSGFRSSRRRDVGRSRSFGAGDVARSARDSLGASGPPRVAARGGGGKRLRRAAGAESSRNFRRPATKLSARVTFPAASTGAVHVEDLGTGVAVDVTLQDARRVGAAVADGYLVYAGGHASGATVLHRALPSGAEDFLAFETASAGLRDRLRGRARRRRARPAAGGGHARAPRRGRAPRDCASRPPISSARTARRPSATLAVVGCAVDANPAAPWGRPVTAPGATPARCG